VAIFRVHGSLNACTWLSSSKLVAVGAHGVYFLQLVWPECGQGKGLLSLNTTG
jgi:hypothetical protein